VLYDHKLAKTKETQHSSTKLLKPPKPKGASSRNAATGSGKHSSKSNIVAVDVEMEDVNHRATAKGGDRVAGVSGNGIVRNGADPDLQSLFSAQLATKDAEHKAELLRVDIRLRDKNDAERAGLALRR
jgi:hypothetical protein